MATIMQHIAISDGVSPVFQKMNKVISATPLYVRSAARAVESLRDSAVASATRVQQRASLVMRDLRRISPEIHQAAMQAARADSLLRALGGGWFSGAKGFLRRLLPDFQGLEQRARQVNEKLKGMGGGWFSGGGSSPLSGIIGQFAAATLLARGVEMAIGAVASAPARLTAMSDTYSGIQARLRLVTSSLEETNKLNDAIYYSALRARGSYTDMAAAVAKLGLAAKETFPEPQELVPFIEGVQKLFKIGGSTAEEQRAAMLQLSQALASGRLQGDEFRSISEAAPLMQNLVADYMGVTRGELKQLASEGEVTADVIKNAVLRNLDEIDNQFSQIPLKWEDIGQIMESIFMRAFAPVHQQLEAIANSPHMKEALEAVKQGLFFAGGALAEFINTLRWAVGEVLDFYTAHKTILDRIALAIGIVTLAWVGYHVAIGIATLATAGFAAVMSVGGFISTAIATIVTLTESFYALGVAETIAASSGATMWAAILLPVAAVIAAIYGVVAAVNYFADTSISATGIIFGAFGWMFANIWNMVALSFNIFAAFANVLGSFCQDPLAAAYNLFVDIWNAIVGYVGEAINAIVKMIHSIPGMTAAIGGEPIDVRSALTLERKTIENVSWHIAPVEYKNPWETAQGAYDTGANLKLPSFDMPEMPEIPRPRKPEDRAIEKNTGETADNTGAIKDAMEITDEDIKYLRDIAEKEAIDKYTTAEVKIEMGGVHNNVSSDMDLDGMMRYVNDSLFDAMQAGAERVSR